MREWSMTNSERQRPTLIREYVMQKLLTAGIAENLPQRPPRNRVDYVLSVSGQWPTANDQGPTIVRKVNFEPN